MQLNILISFVFFPASFCQNAPDERHFFNYTLIGIVISILMFHDLFYYFFLHCKGSAIK